MNCPHCASENKDAAKFCVKCGQDVAVASDNENAISCPDCKYACKAQAKYCPKCGCSLVAASAVAETMPAAAVGMMPCPLCGLELKIGAKFCGKCGGRIAIPETNIKQAAPVEFTRPELVAIEMPLATLLTEESVNKPQAIVDSPIEADIPASVIKASSAIDPPSPPLGKTASAQTLEQSKFCPKCNCNLKAAAKFCGKCGFSFIQVSTEQAETLPLTENAPIKLVDASPQEAQAVVVVSSQSLQVIAEVDTAEVKSPVVQNVVIGNTTKRPPFALAVIGIVLLLTIGGGVIWKYNATNKTEVEMAKSLDGLPEDLDTKQRLGLNDKHVKASVTPTQTKVLSDEKAISRTKPKPIKMPRPVKTPKRHQVATIVPQIIHVSVIKQAPPPVADDIKLDTQSEAMLKMGERMYANNDYSSAKSLAATVTKKYPQSRRASTLKTNAQAGLDRRNGERLNMIKNLIK